MKILVTGALGYIGTELLHRLLNQQHSEIIAVDNDTNSIKQRLGFLKRQHGNVTFINADIRNLDDVLALPKVDIVVHLAAIVGYITCSEDPKLAVDTNVNGTRNIAALNTPTIFLSTGSVYGEIGEVCDESVVPNPQTLYSQTKVEGESIIRSIPSVIFRPATAFGLSFKVRHDLLVHTLIKDAISNGKIELYQPEAMRSFYSVQKIAELIEYTIFNFADFQGKTINVGCQSGNVKKQDITTFIKEAGVEFDLTMIDGKDLDSRDYNVNYDLLKRLWPNHDEEFGSHIKSIVEYYEAWNQ